MTISKSPHRNTFMEDSYVRSCEEKGETPDPKVLNMYEEWRNKDATRDSDVEWQKNNMEYELRTCDWILEKVRTDDVYAQNLYCAMCNMDWCKRELWKVLKEEYWSCSWRHAGGIIADMRQEGDYIDWYCSGIRDDYEGGYASEGQVTEQIERDLNKLGWFPVPLK